MKKRHPDLENYFKFKYYTNLADGHLNQLINDPETIGDILNDKFDDVEIFIFEEYLIKKRSLKSISNDLNYTYSYTRQILYRSREKLNILLEN